MVTPGIADSTMLLALVTGMLFTVKAASAASTAFAPKAIPVPPVRLLVTVKALACAGVARRQHEAVARRAGLHDAWRGPAGRWSALMASASWRSVAEPRQGDGDAADREGAARGDDGGVGVGRRGGRRGDLRAGQLVDDDVVAAGHGRGAGGHRDGGGVVAGGGEAGSSDVAGELGGRLLQRGDARGQLSNVLARDFRAL